MLERYRQASPKSRQLWERAKKVFCGGINHNIRTFGLGSANAHPPFMQRGEGCHIWDVDGNEYIDYWMTHYCMILGHNHPQILLALEQQLREGWHLGALNEAQVLYAEKLQTIIPELEKMRFCTTGSESTMYATRLARLFTGRKLVAKAWSGWHGGNDALSYHNKYPFTDEPYYNGVAFDYNDTTSVDRLMKKHGKQLAAVIIEPVLGAGGGIEPDSEFLPYLREETESRDILLIFDEIITGFRLCYGSAGTQVFGVKPDLQTHGKIIASGLPIGVYGGRADVMKLAVPGVPSGRWVGGGTFSSHPLTMVAGITTLEILESYKQKYTALNKRGDQLRRQINNIFRRANANKVAMGKGSILFIHSLKEPLEEGLITAGRLGKVFDTEQTNLFQSRLLEEGVFGYHGLGGVSFVHTDEEFSKTLKVIENIVTE
ncbi:MAG: aspartate aminotransferase family protein [Promethearchaeota archaeon]